MNKIIQKLKTYWLRLWGWFRHELPGAILGAFLGAVVGFWAAGIQQQGFDEDARLNELRARIDAVTLEIDKNHLWGTDSRAFSDKGDSLAVKRLYSTEALVALNTDLPRLLPADTFFNNRTAIMLSYTQSLNQLIRHRNRIRVSSSSSQGSVEFMDSVITHLETTNDTVKGDYTDWLLERRPD